MARLLNVHNFMRILHNTLQQLYDHTISQTNLDDVCIEGLEDIADSSSATVEASSVEETKKSRKRKRTDSQEHGMQDDLRSSYDIKLLYFSVCRVIKRLNMFVAGLHDDSQGFMIEHLKASLKGSPEQIAEIVGTSLHLGSILLRKTRFSIEEQMYIVDRCIPSSVGFWTLCLATANDPSDKPSNVRRKRTVIVVGAHCSALGGIFGSLSDAHSSPSRNDSRIIRFRFDKKGKKQTVGETYCPKDIVTCSSDFF